MARGRASPPCVPCVTLRFSRFAAEATALGGINKARGTATLEDSRGDDEILAQLSAALEMRLADAPKGDLARFLAGIRALPVGLRAMAATHELDVSMALDDLGWHFANWHNLELCEETSRGLWELEATEPAMLFDDARRLTVPYWEAIGQDLEGFKSWYLASELRTELEPLNERLYDHLEALPHGLFQYWITYARKYPGRLG